MPPPEARGVGDAVDVADPLVRVRFESTAGNVVSLADLAGSTVIVVYAGRRGAAAARQLGVALHARFGVGSPTPRARVVPIVCLAEVPRLLRGWARSQLHHAAADVTVWIDFEGGMERTIGMDRDSANVAVLSAAGQVAGRAAGSADALLAEVETILDQLPAA